MKTQPVQAQIIEATPVVEITQEYVNGLFVRLFNALEDATGDTVTAVGGLEKVIELFEKDPAMMKVIFKPENLDAAAKLVAKQERGELGLSDILKAFPQFAGMFNTRSLMSGFSSFMSK